MGRRERVTERLAARFGDAAAGGRAGAVRELLGAQYPRLAQALEDTLAKLLQDTEVPPPVGLPWPLSVPLPQCRAGFPPAECLECIHIPALAWMRAYPSVGWTCTALLLAERCAPLLCVACQSQTVSRAVNGA